MLVADLSRLIPARWRGLAVLTQYCVLAAPILLVAGLFAAKLVNPWQYWHIFAEEDGPIEWLTAILYFAAFPLAFALCIRFRKRDKALEASLALILSLGLLFVAMEEISWGQRIFGFVTPEALSQINRQEELNLHNIGDSSVWLDAAFLLVSGFALTAYHWTLPALRPFLGSRARGVAQLVSPPPFLAFYFAPILLLFAYYVANPILVTVLGEAWGYGYIPDQGYFMISRDQEPVECIMGLGFLLFAIWLNLLDRAGVWESEATDLSEMIGR